MLDINYVRQNSDKVKQACQQKKVHCDVDKVLEKDKDRKALVLEIETLRAKQNKLGKEQMEEARGLKTQIKELEPKLKDLEKEFESLILTLPNIPLEDVPVGKDETENKIIKKWGEPKKFDFKPKDHIEIGRELDLIDTETASRVVGTRFGYLKREAALLEFALVQLAFKTLTSEKILKKIADSVEKGLPAGSQGYSSVPFIPVVPPVMIKPEIFSKMARLSEADKDERYYLQQDDLYLVGSAEHTLGPMHMGETVQEDKLPLRYVGFSTSFRREAGSYGKDTTGILRVHQFDKVEMESFTTSENSLKEQQFFVAIQEYLLQQLEIPYQVMLLCTGDMGKPDARQVDIECWLPGQNRYRETHSADLMTDYQSRRLQTKVRNKDKSEFAHMNDATVFAIGRTIIAILENYQRKDGSVGIPKVLQEYIGKKEIKK